MRRALACGRVAFAEFAVGFAPRSTGASGGRDFVSLAAFFGLLMFLVLFGWSVRDGLWGRIEQVLLGALSEGQPPIRLSYHIDNVNKINVNVLAEFAVRFPGLEIVPQRSSDGRSGALILPGLALQADGAGDGDASWGLGRSDKRGTPFAIDALPLGSPLWSFIFGAQQRAADDDAPGAAPLLVAVSRHLFQEHFRYDAYRNAIAANRMVPCNLKALLPERVARIDELRYLVLETKENIVAADGRRATVPSFHAFRVIWVDSFPTPDRTAMVVPLSTYEVLLAGAERQAVELHPETLAGEADDRVVQIRLAEIDLEHRGIAEFAKLASCVGAAPGGTDEGVAGATGRRDICTMQPVLDAAAASGTPVAVAVAGQTSCEEMRERGPVNYPRLLDNGQDLLICSGPERPLRAHEVRDCARTAGLQGFGAGHALLDGRLDAVAVPAREPIAWLGPSRIAVPCGALRDSDFALAQALRSDRVRSGAGDDTDEAWIAQCAAYRNSHPQQSFDGSRAELTLLGYQDATVYPRPGGPTFVALNAVTSQLLGWETTLARPAGGGAAPVFRLDPAYESALVRFGILALILQRVSAPLGAGSLVLYVFLTAVILTTAIAHRRQQYGLLLMSGLAPGAVGFMVSLQTVLGCAVGGLLGYLAFVAAAGAINALLADSSIVAEARMIIGLHVVSFLPAIGVPVAAALWAAMTALAMLVAQVTLRLQGITTARSPIELVKP